MFAGEKHDFYMWSKVIYISRMTMTIINKYQNLECTVIFSAIFFHYGKG
jgi:hypothetical protein